MNKSAMKHRLGVVQLHGGGARELLTKEIIIKLAFEVWLVFLFFVFPENGRKGTLDSEINSAKELRHEFQGIFKEQCRVPCREIVR